MNQPAIWAIADLHLAISHPEKTMEVFGEAWKDYMKRIQENWLQCVAPEDLVLIPGDICWAMHIEEAKEDLLWIDALPGTKVLIRGNHDYWWSSLKKVREALPASIHVIQNDHFDWHDVTIGGARLWDTPQLTFESIMKEVVVPVKEPKSPPTAEETEKIYQRELHRLVLSLATLSKEANYRIAMVHYPPVGPNLEATPASEMLEKHGIDCCLFGHLHHVNKEERMFGTKNGVQYLYVAADYLDCKPLRIK